MVTIRQLLEQPEPGLLGAKLKPLKERLTQLMTKHGLSSQDVSRRIRIMHAGKRVVHTKSFEAVAAATLARQRLKIWHFSRQNGQTTEREVSPQRLVHYPEPARWVGKETWHPQQEAHTGPGGSLMLTFPYSDDRKRVGDILRFGADVEVVGPAGLRSKVQKQFFAAAARYV